MIESTYAALAAFRAKLREIRRAILRAPPTMTLPDWADTYRHLSPISSSTGGPWRTHKVEIARGPMMAVTEPGVKTITIMCATQLMKTELLQNIIGYFAHLDPSPILLAQPKDESVAAFSKERINPMVKATPVLRELIGDVRTRASADTQRLKTFPGGLLAMVSAGSPANLAMRAIRIVLLDEIDKYEVLPREGDPITLAEERSSTFMNRLSVRTCSPTLEETSRIYASYKESDMRKPYVACPECRYEQTWDFFRHVHWEKTEDGTHMPETAKLVCENCQHVWTELERRTLLTTKGGVRWYQTRQFICCGEEQNPVIDRRWQWDAKNQVGRAVCKHCGKRRVSNQHAGFQASKLFSPWDSARIFTLVQKWLEEKDDPDLKQTFVNTQLGLPFQMDAAKEIIPSGLAARAENYKATIPADVLVLLCGVDVQAGGKVHEGRLEYSIWGFGLGEEAWLLEHEIIPGNPAKPEVWNRLEEILTKPYKHATYGDIFIAATCIDSGGHNKKDVLAFVQRMNTPRPRRVWAVKGSSWDRQPTWTIPIWPIPKEKKQKIRRWRARNNESAAVQIGVNRAKEAIRNMLQIEEPGPSYVHFPAGMPPEYYDQLTAERLITVKRAGATQLKWDLPKGRANEALDCFVYAYAGLHGLYVTERFSLENQLLLLSGVKATKKDSKRKPGAPEPEAKTGPKVHRSSWMQH